MRANNIMINHVQSIEALYDRIDVHITRWMARYSLPILRFGLGVIFVWFGALKLFPGSSPAEQLVRNTIYFFDPDLFLPILAIWEVLIGVGFLIGLFTNKFQRLTILLLFLQMPGTALPLLLLPEAVWTRFPFVLTLEGQYIIKNLAIIGSALVLGATVRGGGVISEPQAKYEDGGMK
ncbi:MAG: DoxX family protein [Anaerolineales bacterium]|nr:DoxX family protein [Anaerolineales bacterium]